MIYINWAALYNIYRTFGIAVFVIGMLIRTVGKARKAKILEKAGNVIIAITFPLIVLAFLEAIGINEMLPVLGFSLYDFF